MYLLYFALLVAATSAAPTCKCEDEDKVKVKIFISVIIYINPQLCSLSSRTFHQTSVFFCDTRIPETSLFPYNAERILSCSPKLKFMPI